MKKWSVTPLITLLLIFPLSIFGQHTMEKTGKAAVLHITPSADFEVTGKGNSTNWNTANWIPLPQRKTDGSSYETKVKLLYSTTGIYFLFQCEDNKLTATLTEDFDDIYNEDVVEVFFWTDEGTPLYFEYELSPLDVELPIIVPNFDGEFLGWRPWHYEGDRKTRHATSVTGGEKKSGANITSWTGEFFIPFALLKPLQNVPPEKGATWRANMYRIDYDTGVSAWSWQPIRKNFHDYESFGTFIFD